MKSSFHLHRPSLSSAISLLAFLAVPFLPFRAEAITLLDQPRNAYDFTSQVFPDFPTLSSAGFDDFTVTAPTTLTSIIAYGTEDGSSATNVQVLAAIWSTPDLSGSPLVS
jgi:hypothetical protein